MKTYTILPFRCRVNQDGLTNVIETIIWRATQPTDIDGTIYDLTVQGLTKLPAANPSTFIETSELTKEQVIEWIETYDDVDSKFNQMVNVKRNQLNPTYVNISPNF
jgi:hypothetical protein